MSAHQLLVPGSLQQTFSAAIPFALISTNNKKAEMIRKSLAFMTAELLINRASVGPLDWCEMWIRKKDRKARKESFMP